MGKFVRYLQSVLFISLMADISSSVAGESLEQSVDYIRTISYLMIIFSVYLTTNGVIQGSGDVLFASLCSLSTLGVRVTLSYILVYCFGFGHEDGSGRK